MYILIVISLKYTKPCFSCVLEVTWILFEFRSIHEPSAEPDIPERTSQVSRWISRTRTTTKRTALAENKTKIDYCRATTLRKIQKVLLTLIKNERNSNAPTFKRLIKEVLCKLSICRHIGLFSILLLTCLVMTDDPTKLPNQCILENVVQQCHMLA